MFILGRRLSVGDRLNTVFLPVVATAVHPLPFRLQTPQGLALVRLALRSRHQYDQQNHLRENKGKKLAHNVTLVLIQGRRGVWFQSWIFHLVWSSEGTGCACSANLFVTARLGSPRLVSQW